MKHRMTSQKNKGAMIAFLGTTAFVFVLGLLSPLISDDFIFSRLEFSSFRELIQYVLYYGNGRVLGNLSVLLTINVPWLTALIKAVAVAGIVTLIPYVVKTSKHIYIYIYIYCFSE